MPTHRPRPTAFTLIEMLVVIGIIVILIGILIPVIKSVRESAWNADTQNSITQISAASTRYYQDFNAYPGVFSNSQMAEGGIKFGAYDFATRKGTLIPGTGENMVTMSENLVLSLLGGGTTYRTTPAPWEWDYDQDLTFQMRGPKSLNPANPKQYPPYMNVRKGDLSEGNLSEDTLNRQEDAHDTDIPEFMDAWPDGDKRPIIYVRARSGAQGVISDYRNTGDPTAGTRYQYDVSQYSGYLTDTGYRKDGLGTITTQTGQTAQRNASSTTIGAFAFFKHPTTGNDPSSNNATGTAKEKDRFLIFAAGKDRIFGTSDDIVSAGGAQ